MRLPLLGCLHGAVVVFSLIEDIPFSHRGYFFLSQRAQSSLSNFAHSFEPTEGLRHTEFTEASPPTPLRMERGVITEIPLHVLCSHNRSSPSICSLIGVTSHTTPLSIRRGAGGEVSEGLRHTENTERYCFRWG